MDESLLNIIEHLISNERMLVMFHRNGDPDAVGSAIALRETFPNITITSLGGISAAAKNILSFLDIEIPEISAEASESFDAMIILDTSTPSLLEHIPSIPKIIIDHHARNSGWQDRDDVLFYHTDPGKRSCAEIIYSMFLHTGNPISQTAKSALMAGILTDTGHLTYSTPETLTTMASLLASSDVTLEEIHNALNIRKENLSKKIAKLRAAQRLRMEEFRGVLITSSEVNAYEGDAARALLGLGSDVAMVASTRKTEYRISARCTPQLVRRGIHLGTILENVGSEVNGQGGGHPGAAGLSGIGDAEAILNICREKIKSILKE